MTRSDDVDENLIVTEELPRDRLELGIPVVAEGVSRDDGACTAKANNPCEQTVFCPWVVWVRMESPPWPMARAFLDTNTRCAWIVALRVKGA